MKGRQSGKYEYITELLVKGVDKWTVKGVQDKGSVYDYSNLIQHASVGNNQYREIRIESHLGDGDDKVFYLPAQPISTQVKDMMLFIMIKQTPVI